MFLSKYSIKFWLLNIVQMVERLAYWITIIQIPIYIAQKDVPGGLHFAQTTKGLIFFWWALIQNMTPVFWGAVSDRIGQKRSLFISSIFIILCYILLATQRDFFPFLFGTIVLGFGLGSYKPALQGWLAKEIEGKNTSLGWGIYIFLVNLSVFAGPILSIHLKNISWQALFFGSAIIFTFNLVFLAFIRYNYELNSLQQQIFEMLFKTILTKRVLYFILIMSGFTITYMQFYETLPNYIFDWSDTSNLARYLPDFMTSETPRGRMIAYEWIYNLNSGLVVLLVLFMAKISEKIKITQTLSIGILLAGVGLFVAGYSQSGILLVLGVVCYTLGELTVNPKFPEYIANIAPFENKSLYLGVMNISWAIGLAGGGLIGGWLYKHFAEKAYFAQLLLKQKGIQNVPLTEAVHKAVEITGMNHIELTKYLWDTYNPHIIWYPFLVLSFMSVIGMYIYSKKYE